MARDTEYLATEEVVNDTEPAAAQEQVQDDSALNSMSQKKLGKYVRQLWKSWDTRYDEVYLEGKISYLRYKGVKYVSRHPDDRTRLFIPPNKDSFSSRSFNRIERAVDTYVSQVMADQPVLEAQPKSQEDEDLDAADAASDAIMGEWTRMEMNEFTTERLIDAGIDKSSFVHFMWDPSAAGTKPAQMFFEDEATGRKVLDYADRSGERTTKAEATQVWQGQIAAEELSIYQVRASDGHRYIHDAPEILIGRNISLRKAFALYPELEDEEIGALIGHTPEGLSEYIEDFSGKGTRTSDEIVENLSISYSGADEDQRERLLDKKTFFLIYYRAKDRTYRNGYWCHVFGKGVVPRKGRGTLKKWGGLIPLVQLKFLYDKAAPLGRSLVDILRFKQDALDFVETNVMKYVRSMKARYLVHSLTVVNREQLKSDQDDIVYYSGAQQPGRMEPPQMPPSLATWHERLLGGFDDDIGIHRSSRGVHQPGVQSGRHVEALQAADQTILSLTRKELVTYLRRCGRIMLAGMKGYWTEERIVALVGRDRPYAARAFSATDFGDSEDVVLSQGSLLMLSPSQRANLQTALIETGAFTAEEIRRYFPTQDVGGFELPESPYYQRARRENEIFLAGPPDPLMRLREEIEQEAQDLQDELATQMQAASIAQAYGDQQIGAIVQRQVQEAESQLQALDQRWRSSLAPYLPELMPFEGAQGIAMVHWEEHSRALSRGKAERIKSKWPWWYAAFLEHAIQHGQAAGVPGIVPPPQPQEPGAQPAQVQPAQPQQALPAGAA